MMVVAAQVISIYRCEITAHPGDCGGRHELYFMCDDPKNERAALAKKAPNLRR
ncbi:hypothetical protein HNQ77_004627 [Silvibacterium bohemicum]|uniref:Uncharacterized protein n=1 Tax=Silvibacterium bohemicum TaxID=1577686 RepID=A0A841K7U8_9BACT|nr:hypothetical protein [Silvibacterium bohemicum]